MRLLGSILAVALSGTLSCTCSSSESAGPTPGASGTGGSTGGASGAGGGSSAGLGGSLAGSGGSAAGSAGAGASGAPSWVTDNAYWSPVAELGWLKPGCSVFAGNVTALPLPPLGWSSCGTGCEVAKTEMLGGAELYGVLSTTFEAGGPRTYLRLGATVSGKPFRELNRWIRLADGELVAALRQDSIGGSVCGASASQKSTDYFSIVDQQEALGRPPHVPGGAWRFGPAGPFVIGAGQDPTASAADGGSSFVTGAGSVRRFRFDTLVWETLETSSGAATNAAEGDLAIWIDKNGDPPSVRGFAPDGLGVRTIVDSLPAVTRRVALSHTQIVGVLGDVDASSMTTAATLWRAPRKASLAQATVGAKLPGFPAIISSLVTWDDYAALFVALTPSGPFAVYLVQLSSNKTWRIDAHAGHELVGTLALSDGVLYLTERLSKQDNVPQVRRIYRYALSAIGANATALP